MAHANDAQRIRDTVKITSQVGSGGRVRRASFDDLNAIIDINDSVYDGLDYMPAMFYQFMHSKLHEVFVYEEGGELIALMVFVLRPEEKDLVFGMSARVRPSHQGRGVFKENMIASHILRIHSHLKRFYGSTLLKPNVQAKSNQWQIMYIENVLQYKITDRPRLERFLIHNQCTRGAPPPTSISYSTGIEWLSKSDQLIRHVSKYSKEFIPLYSPWMAIRVNTSGFRRLFSVADMVLVTSAVSSYSTDVAASTAGVPEFGNKEQHSSVREKDENVVKGLSYSTSWPCKVGLCVHVNLYANDEAVLLNHIIKHLRHYARIARSDEPTIGFSLHFPETIDPTRVEEGVKGGLGDRVVNDYYSVTKAVHFIGEFDASQSKL